MDSTESRVPGVYIQEISSLPQSIQLTPSSGSASSGALPVANPTSATPGRGISLNTYFPADGNQIFNPRNIINDPAWQTIEVRRLSVTIEQSLTQGLQWAVFEPNGPALWAQVRNTVSNFMTGLFQQGALQGTTPAQAYFVKCDASTMTQNDIDSGRLVAVVGFAPVKPAEFVVIQIAVLMAAQKWPP